MIVFKCGNRDCDNEADGNEIPGIYAEIIDLLPPDSDWMIVATSSNSAEVVCSTECAKHV